MQADPSLEQPPDIANTDDDAQLDVQLDVQLIEACRKGDEWAWEQIINKYQRLVLSVPLSFGFDGAEAEDIAQITFTILMQSLDNLRNIQYLGSWLYTVAQRHTWRALKRSQRNSPENIDENLAESRVVFGREGLNDLERLELTEWLNQGLSKLGSRCQALLVALYFDPEEPDYTTIAQRLGMPLGSIGPTRARCLKSLQQFLQRTQ